jgi:hypothetical protein
MTYLTSLGIKNIVMSYRNCYMKVRNDYHKFNLPMIAVVLQMQTRVTEKTRRGKQIESGRTNSALLCFDRPSG